MCAHNWAQTQSCDSSKWGFVVIQAQSERTFVLFKNCSLSTIPRSPGSSRNSEFSGRIGAEKNKGGYVNQQRHGNSLLLARGLIHIYYLQKWRTINGEYYWTRSTTIWKPTPYLAKMNMLFHQDNERTHTCKFAMANFIRKQTLFSRTSINLKWVQKLMIFSISCWIRFYHR